MNILQLFSCIALLIVGVHSIKASKDIEDWENALEDFDEGTKDIGRLYWLFKGIKKDDVGKRCIGPNGQRGTCVSSFNCKIKNGLCLSPSNGCTTGICCQVTAKCAQTSEDGSCVITQNGATITRNTGSGTNRVYKIPKVKGVCQVKLEIDLFELEGEVAGDCVTESMTVLGSSTVSRLEICGNNTGQHMYLEYGCASDITIAMKLAEGSISVYSIRIYYIECSSPKRVPPYCLKYLTGINGKDRSFNNNRGQLNNQNYKVCVAPVEGMNSITWQECRDEPLGSFSVSGRSGDPEECAMSKSDWVGFLGDDTRRCGQSLTAAPITVNSRPFIMNVHFDEAELRTPNHIFWQLSDPCDWWNSEMSNGDPLRAAVRMDGDRAIICLGGGSIPIIDYDLLLSLPNLPMELLSMLRNLDTDNTGFCLEYSQH